MVSYGRSFMLAFQEVSPPHSSAMVPVMQDHGVEVARQQPYDSITMDDWALVYRHYKDPAY